MTSVVLKTLAWLVFAATILYSVYELFLDPQQGPSAAIGCAIVGGGFWLLILGMGFHAEAQSKSKP